MVLVYILRAQSSRPWPNEHGMESMFSVIARSEKLCIRVFFGSTDLENLSFIATMNLLLLLISMCRAFSLGVMRWNCSTPCIVSQLLIKKYQYSNWPPQHSSLGKGIIKKRILNSNKSKKPSNFYRVVFFTKLLSNFVIPLHCTVSKINTTVFQLSEQNISTVLAKLTFLQQYWCKNKWGQILINCQKI